MFDNKNYILYNDDCINVMSKMSKDSVDLILTDIPYDGVNRKSNGLRNLDKKDADILTFDLDLFVNECVRICKGSIYIFCGFDQISLIRKKLEYSKLSTRLCIWEKTNPSPMNGQHLWLSGVEICIYGKKPKATFNEHCKNSVWRYASTKSKFHPTEKPLKLFEYIVKTSSNENDIVFDPCFGSNVTGLASARLNRKYIGSEISEKYYNYGVELLEKYFMHQDELVNQYFKICS